MKSLKRAYFAVGMTAMFAMATPHQAVWLAALPPLQALALTLALSLAMATLMTWLSQFHRRYAGPSWLLLTFAAVSVLIICALAAPALALPAILMNETVIALPRLVLLGLFCLTALQTQPASEHIEDPS